MRRIASSIGRSRARTPAMVTKRSPGLRPARAAGVSGNTAVMVSQPSRTSISTPTPPKRPRVSLSKTRYSSGSR
jgi:hypothetical protein